MRYVIAILAIIALILFGVVIFGGGGKKKPSSPTTAPRTLPDYASTFAEVSFTLDGRVVGDEQHYQVRITVGQNERKLELLQGYQNNVVKTQLYDNNETAYDVFLRAINRGGFLSSIKKPLVTDSRGVCATGYRYFFSLTNTDDDHDQSLWTTSCGGKLGTFAGASGSIQSLFKAQLPPSDYNKFVAGINF